MARDICVALGERIRELRKERGWRQIDLAEQAGINEKYISDIEIGKKEICFRMVDLLAQAFGLSISELTKGV